METGGWIDDDELCTEEKHLIDSRFAEHDRNPASALPWEEVKARLQARFFR